MYLGEIVQIPINKISNCDDCDSLLQTSILVQDNCSAEHTWVNGSILIDIPWSLVSGILFGLGFPGSTQTPHFATLETSSLNRTGSRLIEVSVCVKEGSCSLCASMVFEATDIFADPNQLNTFNMMCEQETQGNQVKLTQLNNLVHFTQPCSLHLYGKCKY